MPRTTEPVVVRGKAVPYSTESGPSGSEALAWKLFKILTIYRVIGQEQALHINLIFKNC
ncbi:hypothetical protein [Hymenobacter sp. CRA2]|uniref:hypothetical protein n=1 Tax=Hymenobacter sp. CRA2 TaxID=1955620 RepID=UPI00158FB98F|nr:hypothetical protein [Hymenobacter sp. CRA2]